MEKSIEVALGELTGEFKALNRRIDELRGDHHRSEENAATARKGMYDSITKSGERIATLEHTVAGLQSDVKDMSAVTDKVKSMTEQARGAGTLGRWLISAGGWILSGAVTLAGLYTWWTGRPPP